MEDISEPCAECQNIYKESHFSIDNYSFNHLYVKRQMCEEACDLLSASHPMCLVQILVEEFEQFPTFRNDDGGDSEVLIIAAAGKGFLDFLKAYIDVFSKFSAREGTLAAHMAARRGQLEVLKYLLSQGEFFFCFIYQDDTVRWGICPFNKHCH